jgi:hypothetical protein
LKHDPIVECEAERVVDEMVVWLDGQTIGSIFRTPADFFLLAWGPEIVKQADEIANTEVQMMA